MSIKKLIYIIPTILEIVYSIFLKLKGPFDLQNISTGQNSTEQYKTTTQDKTKFKMRCSKFVP
jgi:hypothetical protein